MFDFPYFAKHFCDNTHDQFIPLCYINLSTLNVNNYKRSVDLKNYIYQLRIKKTTYYKSEQT